MPSRTRLLGTDAKKRLDRRAISASGGRPSKRNLERSQFGEKYDAR
jgi:hypothetical protein